MKLTALPVHGFEDITLDFEQIQTAFPTSGTQGITFAGASSVGPVAVQHGLGSIPGVVLLSAEDATGRILPTYANVTATSFDLYGRDITLSVNSNFYVVSWAVMEGDF